MQAIFGLDCCVKFNGKPLRVCCRVARFFYESMTQITNAMTSCDITSIIYSDN